MSKHTTTPPAVTRSINLGDREPGEPPIVRVGGFKIDQGIAVPPRRTRGSLVGDAMAALEVGESFLIPGAQKPSAMYTQKKHMPGRAFVARVTSAGVRIWRCE